MEVDESCQMDHSSDTQSSYESGTGRNTADVEDDRNNVECSSVPAWCMGPAYDRYWRHRQRVEQWFQYHAESENASNHEKQFHVPTSPSYSQHNHYSQSPLANHYYNLMMYWHQRYHRLLSEFRSEQNELRHQGYSFHNRKSVRGRKRASGSYTVARSFSQVSQSSCTSTDQPQSVSRKRSKNSQNRIKCRHGRIEAKLPKRGNERIDSSTGTILADVNEPVEGCMYGSDIIFDVDPQLLHGSQDEEDIVECHMEITDEMLEFFAQSAIHRKERDAKKAEESENEKAPETKFVDISKADKSNGVPTTAAPVQRPGQKRTAEMKQLYGRGAAMIHGMETAMQLNFDRILDLKQPKHWPHLPLNIKFKD